MVFWYIIPQRNFKTLRRQRSCILSALYMDYFARGSLNSEVPVFYTFLKEQSRKNQERAILENPRENAKVFDQVCTL